MAPRAIRLYGIPLSHPALAVRGMLDQLGLRYDYVPLLSGAHPVQLRALGFRGVTVPAMRLPSGERVQGSLRISRALDRERPGTLFPSDPAARRAVEEAEAWAERVLQPVPRRVTRWGLNHSLRQRRWFARAAMPLPLPDVMGLLLTPLVPIFVAQARATTDRVRQDLKELPAMLDEVERLLAAGVIGADAPNAADFQIAASVRALLGLQDTARLVEGRPAADHARRLVPDFPSVPRALPADW